MTPESEAFVRIFKDRTWVWKGEGLLRKEASKKGRKRCLKPSVTGNLTSLLWAEEKVFIQIMIGVVNNLPNLSIGPAKLRRPTKDSKIRLVVVAELISCLH